MGWKRCKGITKKKLQCLLPTSRPDGFCHHHKSQKPTTAPDRTTDRTTAERTTDEHPVPPQTPPHSGDETETDTARGEENFGSATEPLKRISATPKGKEIVISTDYSTPFNASSGSPLEDDAKSRRFPMAADLAYRSYVCSTMLDTFLKGTPEVTQKQIHDLWEKDKWKNFIAKCTDGGKSSPSESNSSGSNEKEFKELLQCIASLDGLGEYFKKRQEKHIRISHQGDYRMTTWNPKARWLVVNHGPTLKNKELKQDFMSMVVDMVVEDGEEEPCEAPSRKVKLAKPETILPPPSDWKPPVMNDESSPIVECKKPVWECLDLFWECKRNSMALNDPEVYLDCALKATEALRYQWSRRFVYCFLHCGWMMQLLHFDRSGLMASEPVDIRANTDKFVRSLLAVFCHEPDRLGYPAGMDVPRQMKDDIEGMLQVVTVNGRELFIKNQEAGPPRDHLVSRATTVFKARLVHPGDEKRDWDWCYKSSWVQTVREHEGRYLEHLQGLPNVVNLLAYSVVRVEKGNDTTVNGRLCSSGRPMKLLEDYFEKAKAQGRNFTLHSGTTATATPPSQEYPNAILSDPRRPKGGSPQHCDDREHRDVVTAWVDWSFDEAVSSLNSLPTMSSIWQQAFSAIKSICDKGVLHRDISFRNIRIDSQQKVKVCDFDMAMFGEGNPTGAQDRTGTIAFMAVSMLNPEPCAHQPVHDCESIFWLCALGFLNRVGIGETRSDINSIKYPGNGINEVRKSKKSIVSSLIANEEPTSWLKRSYTLSNRTDQLLFICLVELAKEFSGNGYLVNFETKMGDFKDKCFDRCIDIIRRKLPPTIEDITENVRNL